MKNVEPWLDIYSLLPGVKWRPAIRKAIRETDYFLSLLSSNSTTGRGFRNSELNDALEILAEFPQDDIFLIPARLDDCQVPHDELRNLTWVDLFPEWNDGVDKLRAVFSPVKAATTKSAVVAQSKPFKPRYHYRVGLVDLDLGLINLAAIAQSLRIAVESD